MSSKDPKREGEEFDHDWYGILGCEVGTSVEEVSRAARKLALTYHPDKTTDPEAPAKFLLIQKAKEILSDESKKKLIDDHYASLKKREQYEAERNKVMDDKRKRFRDALEQKVENEIHRKSGVIDPNEVLAREIKKRTKIIEELRKKNQSMMEEAAEEAKKKLEKKNSDFANYSKTMAEELGTENCQIKIKWKRTATSHSDDSLYQMFKQFGTIEDIVLSTTKGTSAIINFSNAQSAQAAVDAYATSDDYRVSLTNVEKPKQKAAIFTHKYTSSESLNNELKEQIERAKENVRGYESLGKSVYSEWRSGEDNSRGIELERVNVELFKEKEKEVMELLMEAARKKRRTAN